MSISYKCVSPWSLQMSAQVITRYSLLLLTLAAGAMICQAQLMSDPVLVRGRALDPNHAAIAGATVTMQSVQSGFSASSNGSGDFSLAVPSGEYVVKVSADGFAGAVQTITVTQTTSSPLEIILQVAGSTATVTIIAADTLG